MFCVIALTFKLLRYACLTLIKQLDEVQGMFQYHPHSFKDVAPQNALRLRTHFQTCNEMIRAHVRTWKTILCHLSGFLGDARPPQSNLAGLGTHRQGAWQQSVTWNISEEDVR